VLIDERSADRLTSLAPAKRARPDCPREDGCRNDDHRDSTVKLHRITSYVTRLARELPKRLTKAGSSASPDSGNVTVIETRISLCADH
jgi:hypothetical protein